MLGRRKQIKVKGKKIPEGERINLPNNIVYRNVEGEHLFIAPHKPSWIVTGDIGSFMLLPLSEGKTIAQAVSFAVSGLGIGQTQARSEMEVLLQEIETQLFYESIQPEETPVKKKKGSLHLTLTRKCNLRCIHCYMDAGKPMDDELTTGEWKNVIERFTERFGESNITLSGGEPLLRDDFFDIAEYARSKGHSLFVLSNGIPIDSQETAVRLARLADDIQISVDGVSSETTDPIRGKGTFDKIITAIKFLKEAGAKLYLAFVLLPENITLLEKELVSFLTSLDYQGINIRIDDHVTDLGRAVDLAPEYFELSSRSRKRVRNILQQLWEKGWSKPPRIFLQRRLKNCGIGHGLAVDANGDIYPCSIPICKFGNFRTHDFQEVSGQISRLYAATIVEKMEKCSDCEVKFVCSGGCRIENFIKNGSYLIPACQDGIKQEILQRMVHLKGY
ncbi:MAG: radical SAM protein [Candidatus Aminicenantes bacterium]|nr:radical SAM protein [Candidatus Aminicenantes bacterium]NIM81330.1 radical SAM protein [Candidatus Aminicenantes bacterium]NIN20740.1 radical SAM protein [Candidatus Aminicenantes bacterium]NIN44518.1 radical SAM protein [Candidatus Aminicenantes bacterium]NIN87338.1 radical SAM protein [Candidatus Aminicenantes bacterium]